MSTDESGMTEVRGDARAENPSVRAAEVIAFVRGRSVPCPRCGYELRDLEHPRCPECGDELELKLASTTPRFAWLLLSIAPGCFSGVAAVLLMVPIGGTFLFGSGNGVPKAVFGAEAFGVLSALSVVFIYRRRVAIMAMPARRQAAIAGGIWLIHVLAFVLTVLGMIFWP